jgi:hypothetical protein
LQYNGFYKASSFPFEMWKRIRRFEETERVDKVADFFRKISG